MKWLLSMFLSAPFVASRLGMVWAATPWSKQCPSQHSQYPDRSTVVGEILAGKRYDLTYILKVVALSAGGEQSRLGAKVSRLLQWSRQIVEVGVVEVELVRNGLHLFFLKVEPRRFAYRLLKNVRVKIQE